MSTAPAIRYARTQDGFDIAYWKLGRGPTLIHSPNVQLSHVRSEWGIDGVRHWYEALARSFSLVRFDHRGSGLSSRGETDLTIDTLLLDIETVATATSPKPSVLFGWATGGLPAIAYAARHPERVSHLILWSSFARDETHGQAPRMRSLFEMAATDWPLFTESITQAALGWQDAEQARQWAALLRDATTQTEFFEFLQARRDWDVTDDLEKVEAPTLVMHDQRNALASEERSRELAARIPHARFQVCDSNGGAPDDEAIAALKSFVGLTDTGVTALAELTPREREVLSLVADGAGNTEIAERLFISINTVTRHLTHIYAKTGTGGRTQAVRYALEHGLGSS